MCFSSSLISNSASDVICHLNNKAASKKRVFLYKAKEGDKFDHSSVAVSLQRDRYLSMAATTLPPSPPPRRSRATLLQP